MPDRRRTKGRMPPLRERFPELFELPFVKPVDGWALEDVGLNDIDYWAPDTSGEFPERYYRGAGYALLTAELLARGLRGGVLLTIVTAMAAKSDLLPPSRKECPSADVAEGFIAVISALLQQAATNGTARLYLAGLASKVAARVSDGHKDEQASMQRAADSLRRLVDRLVVPH